MRCASSIPARVVAAVVNDLNPRIVPQRALIARWSCSTTLFRYAHVRTCTPLWCANIRSRDWPRERVLMVQPTQHRFREHDEALSNAMSGLLSLEGAGF